MSKDIKKTVDRIKTFTNSSVPILSVYFHLPIPKTYTKETIINKLQTHINANLTIEQRSEMKQNIQMIVGFMEEYQQTRNDETLAFFSADSLFEVLHLPYKVDSTAKYAHDPYLEPYLKAEESS